MGLHTPPISFLLKSSTGLSSSKKEEQSGPRYRGGLSFFICFLFTHKKIFLFPGAIIQPFSHYKAIFPIFRSDKTLFFPFLIGRFFKKVLPRAFSFDNLFFACILIKRPLLI
jgi:hypothetical protein